MPRTIRSAILLIVLLSAALLLQAGELRYAYPQTQKIAVCDTLQGTILTDNYRWLENAKDSSVIAWTEAEEQLTHSLLDSLPQRAWLIKRLDELWRYDDESVPNRVLDGERIFISTKKKEDEKWVFCTMEKEGAARVELINPNKWDATETLDGAVPSRDGKYVAFGKARGGDENSVYRVMITATGEILPDTLRGWKQGVSSWMPDNSGFYYSAKPLKGEVPEGEENYWHAAWFHKLGTPSDQDRKVFWDDSVKEYWHGVGISEDGRWEIFSRSLFNKNEIYYKRVGTDDPLTPLATGFDAEYSTEFIGDTILITTDLDAPNYKVYVTDTAHPQKEAWKEFIPETKDRLDYVTGIAGHLYASYLHAAHTVIKIYNLQGKPLRDLPLPTLGSGHVSGYWSRPETWVYFSSFTYPSTTFRYSFKKNKLTLYRKYPVPVDVDKYTSEQIWYDSKDGTPVSMFLIHRKGLKRNGRNPVMLTGYGGFNISMTPGFSTTRVTWLEAGGMIAIPNLRGGGEYGRTWHEAGMREKKQNVFDDFLAAARWLIDNGYTNPEKLVISGGSNGGLLVGAATVQAPELFKAVECAVPLLDMVNYHKFGLANIWAEEYGSSDDSAQFRYIYAYSPYQNVKDSLRYPAMLITGSENDARVDPLHARKMTARLQEADAGGGPILLLVRKASGHGGGTTITTQIEQRSLSLAFLMDQLGMKAPKIDDR
jgi:prolyl oligopeptidase